MTARSRIVLVALWITSLFIVGQWTTRAQVSQPAGLEVRFVGKGQSGILVANFGGQWLPVKVETMPDGNTPMFVR